MRYPAVLLIPIVIVGVSLFVGNESGQKQPAPDPVSVPEPVNSVPAPVPAPVNPVPEPVSPNEH